MNIPRNPDTPQLSTVASFFISILFWITLIFAACLYAVLALSPRLSEALSLQEHYSKNALVVSRLDQEISHLSKVANALENDPDFVARVAGSELARLPSSNNLQIQVDQHLDYDARIPHIEIEQSPDPPWYTQSVHQLSQPTALRNHTLIATLILFGLAFVCFNDGFFSNRLGTTIIAMCHKLVHRYLTDSQ